MQLYFVTDPKSLGCTWKPGKVAHARRAAECNVAPDVLQENIGQSDPRTTARYYRAQMRRRQKEMERAFAETADLP